MSEIPCQTQNDGVPPSRRSTGRQIAASLGLEAHTDVTDRHSARRISRGSSTTYPRRNDAPGRWHHVLNRAIAKRTAFETRADYRYFLSLLARAVRRGKIEVHAWCLMATHFHLLVRSTDGRLSEAVQRIKSAYTRYFNRTRKRDGPLFRGRFRSEVADDVRYRSIVVSYLDANPLVARLVTSATDYPWGSRPWYARRRGPPWLARGWIEAEVRSEARTERYEPEAYDRRFPPRVSPEDRQWIEQRMRRPSRAVRQFDDVVASAPDRVLAWMQRKAALADGLKPGMAHVPVAVVEAACAAANSRGSGDRSTPGPHVDADEVLRVGLLRDLAGLTFEALANLTRRAPDTVRRRWIRHRRRLRADPAYADVVASVVRTAFSAAFGDPSTPSNGTPDSTSSGQGVARTPPIRL